jgi:hypothetical protein
MTDEEKSALRYKLLREKLIDSTTQDYPEEATSSAAGGAFLSTKDPSVADIFKPPAAPWAVAGVVRAIPALYAGGKAARKGEEIGAGLAEAAGAPWPVPQIAGGAGAIVAGAGAATLTQLGLEETKRRLGLEGNTSDSMSESLAHALAAGTDVAMGEVWSQTMDPLMKGFAIPSKIQLSPEEQAAMTDTMGRMRGVYQKVTGHDPPPSWNPYMNNGSAEDNIDATAAAGKLRAAGLDPREARFIAMGNPQTVAEANDGFLGQLFQKVANNSMIGQNALEKFRGTRDKMMRMAVNDLGDRFGAVLPPEKLGDAILAAVNGKFRPLAAARQEASQMVSNALPPGYTMDGKSLRAGFSSLTRDANSLVGSLGDSPFFSQVQDVRQKLSVLAHDMSDKTPAGDAARAQAAAAAGKLDERVVKQLPANLKKQYARFTSADMELAEGQFNTDFVKGLLNNKKGLYQYATKILNDGNADNFLKLEAAAGPEVANNVRAALWQRVANGAVKDEVVRPDLMNLQLNGQGKLGRAFLETVMGKDTVNAYSSLALAQQTLQKRMQETGNARWVGLDAFATRAGLAGGISAYLGHSIPVKGAELIAGLFAPPVIAKLMTNPRAADFAQRLIHGAANRIGPGKLNRLVSYTLEALGDSPENIIAQSGMPGTMTLAEKRKQMEEGQLPWRRALSEGKLPSTGQPMTDFMVNPAGTMARLGAKEGPGQ